MNRRALDRAFVTAQVVLATGLGYAFARSTVPAAPMPLALGAGLLAMAIALAVLAARDLRSSFRVAPGPAAGAVLVERGVYRRLRHPMYNAVTLCLVAFVVMRPDLPVVATAAINFIFYFGKSRYEEALLAQHYEAYAAYRQRTWGVLPGI